jgi:hypothetical protein
METTIGFCGIAIARSAIDAGSDRDNAPRFDRGPAHLNLAR